MKNRESSVVRIFDYQAIINHLTSYLTFQRMRQWGRVLGIFVVFAAALTVERGADDAWMSDEIIDRFELGKAADFLTYLPFSRLCLK